MAGAATPDSRSPGGRTTLSLPRRASFPEENLAAWREVAGSVRGITAVVGSADRDAKGRAYNAAGIAAGGRAVGV